MTALDGAPSTIRAGTRRPVEDGPFDLVEVGGPDARRRRRRIPRSIARLTGPVVLLALWEVASVTGFLSRETLPAPTALIWAARDMWRSGELQSDLWASLQRVLKGTAVGVAVGTVLAVLAGLSRWGENLLDATMQVIKAVPHFALIGLFILWMGIGEAPKITLIALSTMMPIYVNLFGAIRNVDGRLVEAATTLGLNRVGLVRHVILPGSAPGFLVGLRIALTSAWLALVFAETINAQTGLGPMMKDAQNYYQLDVMVLVLVIYAGLGLLSYAFVRFLERRLLAWRVGFDGT